VAKEKGRDAKGARAGSVEDEIDRLFQIPLGEFTPARNALAAKLKKDGASKEAERVKGFTKPSISAWVTNQLYWRERKAFDRLLAAGEQVRTAQLAGKSTEVRAPFVQFREAVNELAKHASTMLRDAGNASSRDTMRRIAMTLEALAAYSESRDAPKPGRLTADVDPPGFEALAALMPQSGDHKPRESTTAKVIPFKQPKPQPQPAPKKHAAKEDARRQAAQRRTREAELRKALHDAERELKDSKRDATTAQNKMKTATARANELEKRRTALEAQLEKANAAAESSRKDVREATSRAEEAAQSVDDAERAVQRARAALKEL